MAQFAGVGLRIWFQSSPDMYLYEQCITTHIPVLLVYPCPAAMGLSMIVIIVNMGLRFSESGNPATQILPWGP